MNFEVLPWFLLFLSKKMQNFLNFFKKPLKVPSLARSVPKPLKVPSLARSVHKPLKVPSLARSVLKPLKEPSLARSVPKPLSIFALRHVQCPSHSQSSLPTSYSHHCEVKVKSE